jgi:hypothetical protein
MRKLLLCTGLIAALFAGVASAGTGGEREWQEGVGRVVGAIALARRSCVILGPLDGICMQSRHDAQLAFLIITGVEGSPTPPDLAEPTAALNTLADRIRARFTRTI